MDEKKPPTIDDPDAPPSEEEKIASARLRDALEDPGIENADAELARALALADEPRELAERDHRVLVERAVAKTQPRGKVIRVVFGVATTLALAAAAVLVLGRLDMAAPRAETTAQSPAPSLVPARSTQELFDEPFAKPLSPLSRGAASARIDRIAMARGGDLRENRFAMWGVR